MKKTEIEFYIGDNLTILTSHLKEWKNKIDIIYIDPPYNTGNTFIYNDNFSDNKDKHSEWHKFMKDRLIVARETLKETGCIFIAIGDDELYRLKILCDEIFDEKNFINNFMWIHGKGKKDNWSRTVTENTLCYAKNKKNLRPFFDIKKTDWAKNNADNDSRGNWFSGSISFTEKRSNPNHKNYFTITSPSGKKWTRQWLISKEEMEKLLSENKIDFGPSPDYKKVPRRKIFNGEQKKIIPKNLIDDIESTREAQNHLDEILGAKNIFDNPKPVRLIEHLIFITQMPTDSIIMDFFAGSGTTAEAVSILNEKDGGNRKCILIQEDEKTWKMQDGKIVPKKSCENAFNAGFKSIAEITKKRIENLINLCHLESRV